MGITGWLRHKLLDNMARQATYLDEQVGHDTDIRSDIQVYDSEIPKIERALTKANEVLFKGGMTFDVARQNVKDIFEEVAGFKVDCLLWQTNIPGRILPEIVIVGRVQAEPTFDHDRQTWEVQHDILGIDQPGAVDEHGNLKSLPSHTSIPSPPSSN